MWRGSCCSGPQGLVLSVSSSSGVYGSCFEMVCLLAREDELGAQEPVLACRHFLFCFVLPLKYLQIFLSVNA